MRLFKIAGLLSFCLRCFVGFVILYAAWQHNPQNQYHSGSHIDFGYLAGLWLFWCVGATLAFMPVIWLIAKILNGFLVARERA
ncbi:hypothetical protein CGI90_24570 [Vibrio parahaemolyticus]|nr:hypothetical protein CGI90_24570 [Vibrio parahaemolyticus]TOO24417.1 hypothetical protein CGH40_22785 [Vibrio parahaemolyticus]TOP57066.1 hypothetical protein CGH13_23410 [Vibrio parahaemolyticus]